MPSAPYDKALEIDPRYVYAWNNKSSQLWKDYKNMMKQLAAMTRR